MRVMNTLSGISLVFLFYLFFMSIGAASETIKNEIGFQSGSMLGLVHLSYGRVLAKRHHLSVGTGYIPKLDNHHELSLFSVRYRYQGDTSYKLNKIGSNAKLNPVNFGITGIYAHNKALFVKQSDKTPRGYYYPTGERILVNYQAALQIKKGLELYVDFSALDIGVVNYFRNFKFYVDNYNFLGLDGVVVYGIGARVKF